MGKKQRRVYFLDQHREELGERIQAAVEARGKTQAWLATELEVKPAHVSKMYKTGSVSLETLAEICLLVSCSLDQLVFGPKTRLPRGTDPSLAKKLREMADAIEPAEGEPVPVRIHERGAKYERGRS